MRSYPQVTIDEIKAPEPEYPCLKVSSFGTVYFVTSPKHAVVILSGTEFGASPLGYVTRILNDDLKPYTGPAIVLEP